MMTDIWKKLMARRKLGRQVTLWYHPGYQAPFLAKMAQSLGMVALRGTKVLAQLAVEGFVKPRDLKPFPMVSLPELGLFHSEEYLARAGQDKTLARIFGIPEHEVKADEVLSAVRWGVSGTLMAARSALSGPARLAITLGGGFHHAEPGMGSGFCVFNDIGVAIRKVREEGFRENIVIIDLDFHQGNGNVVGFLEDPTVFSYSIHGAIWTHLESAGNFDRNFDKRIGDELYLETLEETLPAFLSKNAPGLVFFIAGHDVLEKDSLGQFDLTLAGVKRRDRRVLELLREKRIPGVVTLGGGYSHEASQAALNLVLTSLDCEEPLDCDEASERSNLFRKVLASIDPWDPRYRPETGLNLSDADLWQDLTPSPSDQKIFGIYSAYEIERRMEKSGFLQKLRNLGFEDFRILIDPRQSREQKIQVEARKKEAPSSPLLLLAEFSLRLDDKPASPVFVEKLVSHPCLSPPSDLGLHAEIQGWFRGD